MLLIFARSTMFMAVLICAVTSLLTCTGHPSKTPISHWNSPSAVDRKSREGEIKLVPVEEKRETAFGARMPVRFEGLIGRELDEFLETDLLDRLQRSNISVMFQAGAERDGNRIVTGVFPDVFYSGCVVVVVTSGRMPHN